MSNSIRDRLISYLAAGVSQSAAAEAVGVSPSYVTELLDQPGVRSEVAAVRGETLHKQLKADEKLELGEAKALEKMVAMIPYSRNLGEVTKTFAVLNAAKRKAAVLRGEESGASGVSVTIVLPKAAELMLQVNSQNNVVEVQGRSIAPLPSKELPKLAASLRQRASDQLAVPSLEAPEPPHVVEHGLRREERDRVAAQERLSILDDHKLVLNGVQVVI